MKFIFNLELKKITPKFIKNNVYKMIIFSRIIIEKLIKYSYINHDKQKKIHIIENSKYKNFFCGYYDISPFNPANENQILIHATNLPTSLKSNVFNSIDLGIYDIKNKKLRIIDSSSAWNWQQGCRLQWLNKNKIIYNVIENNSLKSKVFDISSNKYETHKIPISIKYDEFSYLSIDYYSLSKYSEYGYLGLNKKNKNSKIKIYNIFEKQSKTIFDWKEQGFIKEINSKNEHINHILVNPNRDHMIFIHRYWIKNRRYDSLITYSFKDDKFDYLIQNQVVSHYCWLSNEKIFGWFSINNRPGYYSINIINKEKKYHNNLDDGHPNLVEKDKIITDRLIRDKLAGKIIQAELYDLKTKKLTPLLRISHPTLFDHSKRCDMHISLSLKKNLFQIDSLHVPNERKIIIGKI